MTLNQHQFPTLFHGTGAILNKGDTIEPRSALFGSANKVAFASTDIRQASEYAKQGMEKEGTLFAPVYSVSGDDAKPASYADHMYTSDKGLKIGGVAKWVTHNDESFVPETPKSEPIAPNGKPLPKI